MNNRIRILLPFFILLISLTQSTRAALYISEFMATNTVGLKDENGDYSDWIEIANTGPSSVNLGGYKLTDDATNLAKWVFPSKTLAAGQTLVVFASDKDRRDPAGQLHTNFKLRAGGEYLALVKPDGTVDHDYAPTFPAQVPDVSYGLSYKSVTYNAVTAGDALKYKAPGDATDEADWYGESYDDSTWTTAHSGLGYATAHTTFNSSIAADGNVKAVMHDLGRTSLYMRYPFSISDVSQIQSLKLRMKYDDGYVAYIDGLRVDSKLAGLTTPQPWNATPVGTLRADVLSTFFVDTVLTVPASLHNGTNILAIHGINASYTGASDALFVPELIVTNKAGLTSDKVYFTSPSPGSDNSLGAASPGPKISDTLTTTAPPDAGPTTSVTSLPLVTSAALGFSGVQGQNGWNWGYWPHTAGATYTTSSFTNFAGGSGQGAWVSGTQLWTGTVWDRNTAGAAPWTFLSSTAMHPNDSNPGTLDTTIARWTSTVSGTHTITGRFNRPATAGDGTTGRIYKNGVEIFSALTKGDIKPFSIATTLAVGDKIDFAVDVGPADDDGSDSTNYVAEIRSGSVVIPTPQTINVPITTQISRTKNPVSSVTLKYRIMYGSEVDVAMNDNGTAGDAVAGDGLWTGVISTNQLYPGQMLRWRIQATDNAGNLTKDPPYLLPDDSEQYYGTVAIDSRLATTQLPTWHWFMDAGVNPDQDAYSHISLYYEGEFYDNIRVNLHGQSTRAFAKKSYNIDFNGDHRFKYSPTEKRVKDIKLLSNWADKSKIRNTLAWELYRKIGHPAHFCFPVRIQRNGEFYGTADCVEDGDDLFLSRAGLDENGTLYKVYNLLSDVTIHSDVGGNGGGVERKVPSIQAPTTADFADLGAVVAGLDPATRTVDQRLTFAYDNIDIPGCVNYLVGLVLTSSADVGHKNFYIYRDTFGSGEWMLLPWDMDLSIGHNWNDPAGASYLGDNITATNNPNPGFTNRLFGLIYNNTAVVGTPLPTTPALAALREMFLRRLRSTMDTYLGPIGGTSNYHADRIAQLLDQIDPGGAANSNSDADLDYSTWGSWGNADTMLAACARITDPTTGYIPRRRTHLYTTNYGPATYGTIPAAQAIVPGSIQFDAVISNPGLPDSQHQEYFVLVNPGSTAVDISSWKITGGITHTFRAGTVIPAVSATDPDRNKLYVARSAPGFRSRAASPKGGEQHLVSSGYSGQLSARGETLSLLTDADVVIATTSTTAAPTPAQQALRVSEILFAPTAPTLNEMAAMPGVIASDFEFIELINTGATPLALGGAKFTEGVVYTFPVGTTLNAGERLLLVANPTAFALRHGALPNVFGPYVGELDNGGEKLQIVDSFGESVLSFTYDDDWYPQPDQSGYSLMITNPVTTNHTDWDQSTSWGVSATPGGSPGTGGALGNIYTTWTNGNFTAPERLDPQISGAEIDNDSDGLNNLLEYALAGNPKIPSASRLPVAAEITVGADRFQAITFTRPQNSLDLTYTVETSSNMNDWAPDAIQVGSPISNPDGTETVTFRDTIPATSQRRFIHVNVSLQP